MGYPMNKKIYQIGKNSSFLYSFLFYAYREAIVFLTIAILSLIGLANSVVDDESCDADNYGCVEWEIK